MNNLMTALHWDPDHSWAFLALALAGACFITAGWLMSRSQRGWKV